LSKLLLNQQSIPDVELKSNHSLYEGALLSTIILEERFSFGHSL